MPQDCSQIISRGGRGKRKYFLNIKIKFFNDRKFEIILNTFFKIFRKLKKIPGRVLENFTKIQDNFCFEENFKIF